MASASSSSRFSTLKLFKLTSTKPPPPPPKDAVYLYPRSNNPSLASLSSQSLLPTGSPKQSNPSGALSIRTPSPTPSRVLQSSPQQQHRPPLPGQQQQHQSPPPSVSSSTTLSPDSNSGNGKRGFFRKMSSLGKRSTSKTSTVDGAPDHDTISLPWNVQHHIHIDESFQGIPPSWSSSLAELGYSEAEIALILKGRRNRIPDLSSVQDCLPYASPSRSQSPTTSSNTANPPARSTSLRRQRSDGSTARSERSIRVGPPPPPPPLPLPLPPQTPQVPSPSLTAPAPPPPTPVSAGAIVSGPNNPDDPATPSEAQYVYVNHHRHTPNGLMAVPPPAPVPIIQPAPVRQTPDSRKPISRNGSVKSDRERRLRMQTPPRKAFRVVNETSPPPVYSDHLVHSGSPPPITLEDVLRPPPPQEKASFSHSSQQSPVSAPRNQIRIPPPAKGTLYGAAGDFAGSPGRGTEEEREQEEQDHESDRSSSERRRTRPTLSIPPPRISLRKDTLEDLSSWSASLFSSLPSALHDSPGSSGSTTATSASTTQSPNRRVSKHRTKPSVTLPTIVLQPEVREEAEDEDEGGEEEDMIEHDYAHTASPLYHELMGMMQGRATAVGSPVSGSFQLDTASSSSHGTPSRDSQLTIRFDPRRDSSRDSSASISTLTHATIVRGASVVRRVRADVVTTRPVLAKYKAKEPLREKSSVHVAQVVQEGNDDDNDNNDDEGDSSSDAGSDASGSPVGTLALTSGPNSLEGTAASKCPRQARGHGSPLPSPSPSPLRASFPEPTSEKQAQAQEETQIARVWVPYVTPPPSAPLVATTTTTTATDLESPNSVPPSSLPSGSTELAKEQVENGLVPPRFTCTGAATPRYPAWLAAVVLPLAEFIDDSADPRALFTDLQEIAQGESGLVYSAHAAPAVAPQFRPSMAHPPAPGKEEENDTQQKQELVAIKRVRLLRGGTEKLTYLRRELELTRALRHANVLRMERLYVDVVEESLWIGMELMDRSLADVLAVVGEDAGSGSSQAEVALEEAQDDGGSLGSAGVVEISEKMVARFVRDILLALSYIRKHHIAHRDVRSDNLLLSRSGVVKLSDFSTAVYSPPGTPKLSDQVGVIYWQAPEMRTGVYDPHKVDVWSLGATMWELVHGNPPFADVQDTRLIAGAQLPPVRQPEAFSRSFHDFLHLCSQPAASRPDPDELLNAYFVRAACPRSEIVRLLGQCKAIDEQQLLRQSIDSDI